MPQIACNIADLVAAGDYALPAWASVVRVYNKLVRRLERMLEAHGLSLAHFEILLKLSMAEGMTQQELASRLLVTKGNVCTLLDRMESNQWVERRAHPEDRRANRLFLTQKGKKLLENAFPSHLKIVDETMGILSNTQQKNVYEALSRLDRELVEE